MKLSIALCTYNGESFLPEQLASLLDQTLLPGELVVCDDASTDNTLSMLNAFAQSAPFPVRIYRNSQNLGSTRNFERAIILCRGDVIALADQDDVWYPHKLESIRAVLSRSPGAGLVFSDAEVVDESSRPLGYTLWQAVRFNRHEQKLFEKGKAFEVLLRRNVVTGAAMAFRAQFRTRVLPIPGIWVHDAWIALLVALTADLAFIAQPLVKYRQHPQGQIGAVKGLAAQYRQASQVKPDNYHLKVEQYRAARDRLLETEDTAHHQRARAQLEAKMAHVRARASTPRRRLRRLTILLRELAALRYHHYSSGLLSFVKDFLMTWE